MTDQEYPRGPTGAEFKALHSLICDKQYPAGDACAQEREELSHTLAFAVTEGKFIVTHAMSDSPGYFGPMVFVIWPDTSVTMYRFASMDLPSFDIWEGDWYETDRDGMPWV